MKDLLKFYINGTWVDPQETLRTHEVIDPSTEEVCAVISLGDQADTDAAVAAAKAAFPAWAATAPAERRKVVERILEQYYLRKEEPQSSVNGYISKMADW